MSDKMKTTARTLVEMCSTGRSAECPDLLYAPDAVSMEAGPSPDGRGPETVGVEGIKGKHAWWDENFEVHGGAVEGPYFHGEDRFAVIFEMDATHKASGQRSQMKEVAIYTTDADGRITREEFFYDM